MQVELKHGGRRRSLSPGDDEYSRLRAAASVFVELQEEEEHSFKSLLEKEVL